jgi:hypothetical protein
LEVDKPIATLSSNGLCNDEAEESEEGQKDKK